MISSLHHVFSFCKNQCVKTFAFSEHCSRCQSGSFPPLPRTPLPTGTPGVGLAGARPRPGTERRLRSLHCERPRGGGVGLAARTSRALAGEHGGKPACPAKAGERLGSRQLALRLPAASTAEPLRPCGSLRSRLN